MYNRRPQQGGHIIPSGTSTGGGMISNGTSTAGGSLQSTRNSVLSTVGNTGIYLLISINHI
jgi:hypothetical protein